MSTQSKIFKDLLKYFPQVVAPGIISFISVPIFTRIFEPVLYGDLNLVRVTINILQRLSGWTGLSIVRFYPYYEKKNSLKTMIYTAFNINIIFGLFTIAITFIVFEIINVSYGLSLLFKVGAVYFSINLICSSLTNILRINRKINALSIYIFFTRASGFIISLFLILKFNISIEAIIYGDIIVLILTLPFLWNISVKNIFSIKEKIDLEIIRKFASYGIPLSIGTIGIWLLDMSDRYVIKFILGSHELGVYSSCYNVIWNTLFLLINVFYLMEQPLALRIYEEEGEDKLISFIYKETKIFLLFFIPCMFFIIFHTETIFTIMVDKEYSSGSIITPFVAISSLMFGLTTKYQLLFLALNKTKLLMNYIIIFGLINVIINFLLIPLLGILGAAISTLVSYSLYFFTIYILSKKHKPEMMFPLKSIIRIIFSISLCIIPFYFLNIKWNLLYMIISVIISSILYVILLRLLKEISTAEILNYLKIPH